MLLLFLPRPAAGHTPGLSTAELDVDPSGRVDAHFVFASAEPLHGTPLRDDDLAAFLLQGVEVTADGVRCDATFRGAGATEGDGLALDATYACATGATSIALTLFYLNDLGPGHREVARIVARDATAEAILTRDRRQLALALPGGIETHHARTARRLTLLTAAFATFMVTLFVWRFAATRRERRRQGFLKSRPSKPPPPFGSTFGG
jgi:hypothetical protein